MQVNLVSFQAPTLCTASQQVSTSALINRDPQFSNRLFEETMPSFLILLQTWGSCSKKTGDKTCNYSWHRHQTAAQFGKACPLHIQQQQIWANVYSMLVIFLVVTLLLSNPFLHFYHILCLMAQICWKYMVEEPGVIYTLWWSVCTNATSEQQFVATKNMAAVLHPPYSP